eukprot:g52688.t1
MGIVMHTWIHCPYCWRAKFLLKSLGHTWEEKNGKHPDWPTVPYIIQDGVPIGGYTELRAAVDNGTFK